MNIFPFLFEFSHQSNKKSQGWRCKISLDEDQLALGMFKPYRINPRLQHFLLCCQVSNLIYLVHYFTKFCFFASPSKPSSCVEEAKFKVAPPNVESFSITNLEPWTTYRVIIIIIIITFIVLAISIIRQFGQFYDKFSGWEFCFRCSRLILTTLSDWLLIDWLM